MYTRYFKRIFQLTIHNNSTILSLISSSYRGTSDYKIYAIELEGTEGMRILANENLSSFKQIYCDFNFIGDGTLFFLEMSPETISMQRLPTWFVRQANYVNSSNFRKPEKLSVLAFLVSKNVTGQIQLPESFPIKLGV
jgi:hypothetical protein